MEELLVATEGEQRNMKRRAFALMIFLIIVSDPTVAQNLLSLKLTSQQTMVVELSNDQEIAALQFSVTSSENIVLREIRKTDRTNSSDWIMVSHLKNNHTLNVVLISLTGQVFSGGRGPVAEISFHLDKEVRRDSGRLSLEKVVAADRNATNVLLAVEGLSWHPSSIPSILLASKESSIRIGQNFPNPFNPSTKIPYVVERPSHVRLDVYDVTGRQITTIVDQHHLPGSYSAQWSGVDANGHPLSSGIYFARLETRDEVAITKMILTK